jgi:hypothetical protein
MHLENEQFNDIQLNSKMYDTKVSIQVTKEINYKSKRSPLIDGITFTNTS